MNFDFDRDQAVRLPSNNQSGFVKLVQRKQRKQRKHRAKGMFKLQFNREGIDRRVENVIGHDRFCQSKHFSLPRYKRKRNSRRTQEETELAFELFQSAPRSDDNAGRSVLYRNQSGLSYTSSLNSHNTFQYGSGRRSRSAERTLDACYEDDETSGQSTNDAHRPSNWDAITRCFSTIAGTLACRDSSTNSADGKSIRGRRGASDDQLQERASGGRMNGVAKPPYIGNPRTLLGQTGNGNAHAHGLVVKYLESQTGRYVLIAHLPEIGSRATRLWYLVNDTCFSTERLLTITKCSGRLPSSSVSASASTNEFKEICQALQHAYVSPILDLTVLNEDRFGGQFVITLTAVTSDGSLRDLLHRCRWTESWQRKYGQDGLGIPEVHVQRLSCHILVALLHLRSRGLPAGIGVHFHPGNILIQQGTARFSAIDNILFTHPPSITAIEESTRLKSPESLDSVAFARLLFSMCSGYDLSSTKLSQSNCNDIRDYPQVSEVLEYILENPENSLPTIHEIAKLDFYRNLDLRELRGLPAPEILSRPPNDALNVFVESLEVQENSATLKKSHSISTPCVANVTEDDSKRGSIGLIPSCSSRNSSQVSLYWTPPNSLGFITKAVSNDSRLEEVTK